MTDLTEKWKNGELEDREYYIKSNKGDTYIDICADGNFMFTNYRSIEEILAPVPSYAEWQKLKGLLSQCVDELSEFNNSYYPETQELLTKIDEVLK